MAFTKDESSFSGWSIHINKPVYSIDVRRLGMLRKRRPNQFITIFRPKESTNNSGIKLSITAYEARRNIHKKMKNFLSSFGISPRRLHRTYAILQLLYKFTLSGYKANLMIYHLIRNEITIPYYFQ